MTIYFDAVLTKRMVPVFNGTSEETLEWVKNIVPDNSLQICIGRTMQIVSPDEYLAMDKERKDIALRAKRETIMESVRRAMWTARNIPASDTTRSDSIANKTVDEIMKLL